MEDRLVSIRDKYGREYVCPLDAIQGKLKRKEDLTEEELKKCFDIESLIDGLYYHTPILDGN